jgi:hypothetical protein
MLGSLAAHQGATRLHASLGDSTDDLRDLLGNDLAGGDVVGHEQRFRPDHDEVIDDHGDEIDADGVVPVQLLREHQLRTHPVR